MPKARQQAGLQDPGKVLRGVAGHGPGPGVEAVQFQGAGVVAMARTRGRKVQMEVGLDVPAKVTLGRYRRQVAEAEFRENKD